MILETINSPADVKRLSEEDAVRLCQELRRFLVEQVSRTGGHLASNLGVVELTVAIHRVYDTASDRLVLDVGHQCYVHKALTGRRELFGTLRQFGGLSGFPKPYESVHDAFMAGHASDSVSVALGMARARTLLGAEYQVAAVIGDGALGGGLSFEGLNDAGGSGEPLVVILNDNGMSIDKNVGGLSKHLSRMRTEPEYYAFKKKYRKVLEKLPAGRTLYEWSHELKTALKKSLLPPVSTVFEDMGFSYMGPVDGHDVQRLTAVLRAAREAGRPVLVHVHTVKGSGYEPALREPEKFHGVGAFDPTTGQVRQRVQETFSHVFGETLRQLARQDGRVCAITAAMADGTGLTGFAGEFPRRFFDVGIAEGHGVAMAGGMAKQGLIPVFAVYDSFLQRGYDMLVQDMALEKLHGVLAVDRCGLVGADGETHHGCLDYLSQIPGMTVLAPASFAELRRMLRRALLDMTGPVAVRYPRGGEDGYDGDCGDEPVTVLRQGTDAAIVTYGILTGQALRAAELLEKEGVSLRVVKLNRVAPLDGDGICRALDSVKRVVVSEDQLRAGAVGERLGALLLERGAGIERYALRNAGEALPAQGSTAQLRHVLGLDAEGMAQAVREVLK
ncbi:MAG: 1-deoxy-D-xylulose-5-phosphate synthase [Vescimonas sp.]|uniref:1-deoxy-D-xylulose-5-phosphate synthase n=1 Tax=Vescimonas sp. TaxID=2892404 RepID=UPI002A90A829|nr:1-deoxy-D-xylulose-5-phosphate synthase [Vescimonas sp.]MDY5333907.1 1-deoxy-D-xylulose-5-phosphate synthase [Vescimonas sp.]